MPYDFTTVTADSVRSETDAALREADRLVDGVAAAAGAPTLGATLGALELASAAVSDGYGRGAFLGQCHPDREVREAGIEAEKRLSTWRVALVFRRDVYQAVRAFASSPEGMALDGEDARLLEHWARDFRRAGHELDEAARDELERLRTRLVDIEVEFGQTLNEYQDWIEVTREELDGLPDDYVARLDPGERDGTLRVSLDYPELNPFLEQAHARERRRELFTKHWNRAVEQNRPLLEEALRVRHRLAELLRYPSWGDFAMEVKMARRPEAVRTFYRDLLPRLSEQVRGELGALAEQMRARGQDGPVMGWDWRYEHEAMRRSTFGLDQNAIAEYFPLDAVLDGMFALTGEVLGLTYRQVPDARAWHPDVTLHEVLDRDGGELIGSFYADWHPRPGKFGHAAAFPLVVAHRGADGSRVPPVSAILANFTPPGADRPALLKHGEVETLFHEFGHILHMTLSQAAYARFSAAETEWDFTEAPSQIMEHWTWEPEVLRRFARHWRTGEPIPTELVERMRKARWLNAGIGIGIQAFYGQLDLAIHDGTDGGGSPDLDAALRRTYAVTGMPYPEGTFMLSGFGHLLSGYDAGYYGYLWAEVIGDDLFGRFAREGVASPSVGADYRREILEPNGTRDAEELVRAFLGRHFSPDEFLRLRGMA